MGRYCRRGFTAAENQELWDRWSKGESLNSIGRAFGKPSSSIYGHLSPYGGIRPKPRRRSKLSLTLAEREEISATLKRVTVSPYTSASHEPSYDKWRSMEGFMR